MELKLKLDIHKWSRIEAGWEVFITVMIRSETDAETDTELLS